MIEVTIWKHSFKTETSNYIVESTDIDPNTVWNTFCSKNSIEKSFIDHSFEDSGKTTVIQVEF